MSTFPSDCATSAPAEIVALFAAVDRDGDGSVTKAELKKYCQANMDFKARLGIHKGFGWEAVFREFDADDSSSIDIAEFGAVLQRAVQKQAEQAAAPEVTALFAVIDEDHDNTVTKHELKKYCQANEDFKAQLGIHKGFGWEAVFKEFDADHDASISISEFAAALKKHTRGGSASTPAFTAGDYAPEIVALFDAIDKNHNGKVKKAALKPHSAKHPSWSKVFREFDVDCVWCWWCGTTANPHDGAETWCRTYQQDSVSIDEFAASVKKHTAN
jgi:Ca2+-binding EF-hand superfamily protein